MTKFAEKIFSVLLLALPLSLCRCGAGDPEDVGRAMLDQTQITYFNRLTGGQDTVCVSDTPGLMFPREGGEISGFSALDLDGDDKNEAVLFVTSSGGSEGNVILWREKDGVYGQGFFPGEMTVLKSDGSWYSEDIYGVSLCVNRVDRLSKDGCETYEEAGAFGENFRYTYFEVGSRISDRESFEEVREDFFGREDARIFEFTQRRIEKAFG